MSQIVDVYVCGMCGRRLSRRQGGAWSPPKKCPKCGGPVKKVVVVRNPTYKERMMKGLGIRPAKVPEWRFTVFKKPAGLKVEHYGGRVLVLAEKELKELISGRVTMARYTKIPRALYRKFVMSACEALGVPYRAYYLEAVTPEVVKRVRFELPKKKEWEKLEEKAKREAARIEEIFEMLDRWEKFLEMRRKRK